MYYTRLLILLVFFVGGCATGPASAPSETAQGADSDKANTTGEEIALYRQAITELNNNQLGRAEMSFLKMAKRQPDLAGPWANLALVYIKRQQYDKAEEHVQTALAKNPNMPQALNLAGYLASRKGEINKAKGLYEKAISEKPDYALAHYNLALLYDIYLQNLVKAVEHYQRYLSLIDYEDQKTKTWVEELKLNIERIKT
ncbi:MAG: tetratricopeptide repeat protein [Thioalkalispiraceae bacterium]|jgi:Tfp pilus assembly protein PilF